MPPDPSAALAGADFAGQLFFRLWRATHTRTAAALETIGLTPALFAVLDHVRAHENAIQQQIATTMGIDPSTMVALVDELERAGLARRRPRPQDRRAREIVLTPRGRRALTRARALAAEVEGDVLRGLSAAERRELIALLRKAYAAAPPQPPWRSEEG